jgi:hypothetical protein
MGAAASVRMPRDFSIAASVAKMQSIYQKYLQP